MGIVGGLDVHRAQITYDYLDTETGEVEVGRIVPATRPVLREWLGRFQGQEAAFATEGCTGWRFVVEELHQGGVKAHLAEPADTATLRGRKKRAKTDRADARLLRTLLLEGRLPESWIPPRHVLETRITGRLYMALVDQRRVWSQRIQAQLFHQGVEKRQGSSLPSSGRRWATPAGSPLRIRRCGTPGWTSPSGTRMGAALPGISPIRGLRPLRWALYEAAQSAARTTSPDHAYFLEVKKRLGHKQAALSVARKLARGVHHVLRRLGDTAWEEVG